MEREKDDKNWPSFEDFCKVYTECIDSVRFTSLMGQAFGVKGEAFVSVELF